MSLVLLFHCLLLNMFRKLKHSSSAACDLLWIYFMGCIALVPYAGWSWNFSLHKDTTPPQPNHTVTPTHIEPEQYNTRNKSTISRKLLKMDVLTSETCWAVNSEIIKQVNSSWCIFIQHLCYLCKTDRNFAACFERNLTVTVPESIKEDLAFRHSTHVIT